MSLFIPTYFSPISQYEEIVKADKIIFEMEDNFQKQSFRNRCYIYNGNGKQLLSIPVKHQIKDGRKKQKILLLKMIFLGKINILSLYKLPTEFLRILNFLKMTFHYFFIKNTSFCMTSI